MLEDSYQQMAGRAGTAGWRRGGSESSDFKQSIERNTSKHREWRGMSVGPLQSGGLAVTRE